MIRYYIALIPLLLAGQQIYAQTEFGIKSGPNLVNVAFEETGPTYDNVFRPSFHAGLYGKHCLDKQFYIQSELLYSSKGYHSKYKDGSENTNVNLNYISLPVLAGYHLKEKISVLLGLEASYLLSARSSVKEPVVDLNEIWDRKVDLGVATGLAYQVGEKIKVSTRYIHGLLNVITSEVQITNDQGNPTGEIGKTKSQNRVLQLSVGYRLH